MRKAFELYGHKIAPGKREMISLAMPKLYDCTPLSMPVHVIHGKTPGPVLCITAAIHGDEINGIEIIRQLLKRTVLKNLVGTIIAVPIVNVYGFLYQDRYLMDRRDLNRAFPGSEKGSLASRIAHILSQEVLAKSTHCIDLHTGSLHRTNLPQIRANTDNEATRKLANAFGAPVILHSKLRDGSLREHVASHGKPFLLYEAGESLRFDALSIRTGVKGILHVMRYLGMIPSFKHQKPPLAPPIARASYWVRAPKSGIMRPKKTLGASIKKGELLAKIGNPTDASETKLLSPISGIIIGQTNLPMTHTGAALFHIATFEDLDLASESIETLHLEHDMSH